MRHEMILIPTLTIANESTQRLMAVMRSSAFCFSLSSSAQSTIRDAPLPSAAASASSVSAPSAPLRLLAMIQPGDLTPIAAPPLRPSLSLTSSPPPPIDRAKPAAHKNDAPRAELVKVPVTVTVDTYRADVAKLSSELVR